MSNAMNAMLAHEAKVSDDNTFVRQLVGENLYIGFGVVTKYEDGRVDVSCGMRTYTNVEVIVFGVDGWGIKPIPATGDRVLLISSQAPVVDIKEFKATGSMPPYDVSGLKAIPVTDEEAATQLITVDKDKIEITGDNKLLIDADGIQVEDVNENKVTTSDSGVEFEDLNGNKVTCDDSGVAFEDTNGNKITTASAGITVEDKNGCKIETSSSSVKINGKLEIKK